MQLWLFLPYTHQHPFLSSNSFMGSTFSWAMKDLASISSSSWGDLKVSHLPASNHETTGQSYTIKHYQSPKGWVIEVSSAGAACCPLDQPRTTSCCWGWQDSAPAAPRGRWAVGDTKPAAEMWEASWFAELWAKYAPSLDTGCDVPSHPVKGLWWDFSFSLTDTLKPFIHQHEYAMDTVSLSCLCRGVGTTWSLRFLPAQTVLWFYEYWEI